MAPGIRVDPISRSLDEQLRFTGLREVDPEDVADLWAAISPELDGMLTAFYAKLERFSDFNDFHRMNITRLMRSQKRHWEMLFSFTFSPEYEYSVRRVGEVHDDMGLEPEWYVSGYTHFLNEMILALYKRYGKKPARCRDLTLVLTRLVGLDMGLAMSAYQTDMD